MTDPAQAKRQLLARLVALDAEDAAGTEGRAVVELDQASVGRLSRMDALQRQAMAEATARRRTAERARIAAALERIEDGEYGYCAECGEEIAPARLAADPSLAVCADCMRAR